MWITIMAADLVWLVFNRGSPLRRHHRKLRIIPTQHSNISRATTTTAQAPTIRLQPLLLLLQVNQRKHTATSRIPRNQIIPVLTSNPVYLHIHVLLIYDAFLTIKRKVEQYPPYCFLCSKLSDKIRDFFRVVALWFLWFL